MKPSEIKARDKQVEERKQLPMSPDADPPITEAEARAAPPSICCRHDGLIRMTGDKPDRVFYCPIGKQYWRYTRKGREFTKALAYSSKGVV